MYHNSKINKLLRKPINIQAVHYLNQFDTKITDDIIDEKGFTDFFVWDINNKMRYCEIYGNVILFNAPYVINSGLVGVIRIMGINDLENTINVLLHSINKNEVIIVSSAQVPFLGAYKYLVSEMEDMHEYILSIKRVHGFSAPEFKQKRYKYLKFLKEHSNSNIYFDSNIDLEMAKMSEALSIFCYRDNINSNSHLTGEYIEELAIKKAIDYAVQLNLCFHFLYLNQEMVGFNIYEMSENGYAVGHFKKVKKNIIGLSEYFDKCIFDDLYDKGIKYINIMEDVGNKGLRAYKNRLCPVAKNNMFAINIL